MSLIFPPGAKTVTAKYTGDGTLSRIIPLSITPRFVIVITETDQSVGAERWFGDLTEGVVYWSSGAGFRVLTKAAEPANFPLVSKGFDVGKAHNWNNIANVLGASMLLIAI